MIRYYYVFFLLLFGSDVLAQESIRGTILDQKTGLPLSGVTVIVQGSNQGTQTDDQGHFQLSLPPEKSSIRCSLIGYEQAVVKAGKASLLIQLHPQENLLRSISVNPYNIDILAKSKDWDVIDYLFTEEQLILLTYLNPLSGYQLRLLSKNGGFIDSLALRGKPLGLFAACSGKKYLVSPYSSFELDISDSSIRLGNEAHIQQFQVVTLPCIVADSANNYFEERLETARLIKIGAAKFSIRYYYIQKEDPKKIQHNLSVITGQVAIKPDKEEKKFIKQREKSGMYFFPDLEESDRFLSERILFKEIYDPLVRVNDRLYVFNHQDGIILAYAGDSLEKAIPINYQALKGWKKALVLNEEGSKVFALFEEKKSKVIREIHLQDGTVGEPFTLPPFLPERIKSKEDRVYFIGRGPQAKDRLFLARSPIPGP